MTSSPLQPFTSPVVVVGSGLAALAAVHFLVERLRLRPLLVARQPGLACEVSWSLDMAPVPARSGLGRALWERLREGMPGDCAGLDPAVTEIRAAQYLRRAGVPVLLYASPAAVSLRGDRLDAVHFACKGGVRVVRASWWIDATDAGELAALLDRTWRARPPVERIGHLAVRRAESSASPPLPWGSVALGEGLVLSAGPSLWSNEWRLGVRMASGELPWHRAVAAALRQARGETPWLGEQDVVTHASVVPLSRWGVDRSGLPAGLPGNVLVASPCVFGDFRLDAELAAGRMALGESAAATLAGKTLAEPDGTAPRGTDLWQSAELVTAEVAVAGTGTGGAVAAIVAGRRGRKAVAFDALPFPGGMGTGAGIHRYWYGVKGGFQAELDERTRELVPLFGRSRQVMGFHPMAKRLALEAMLDEAGVTFLPEATLCQVRCDGGRVRAALVALPGRLVRVEAPAWIDGTGDGDLCAMAGAAYHMGRVGDGLLHAFTQAAGVVVTDPDGSPRMVQNNADSGFVDPTDPLDLSRARIEGVAQWAQVEFTATKRPTVIYPAIGIRQGRQIDCDYRVTLEDLIEGTRFPDAVSMSSCHFDCHHVDLEFETDEALFWVWLCEQRETKLTCEIPYRSLLPRGLHNVWIACRALGAENDAQYSTRLQRDMQRLGEVAAVAADLALSGRVDSRAVPYAAMRQALERSGALSPVSDATEDTFGPAGHADKAPGAPRDLQADLLELREKASPAMWRLYRFGNDHTDATLRQWLADASPDVSWRAAAVLAMRADPTAEERLIAAVRQQEDGYADASRPSPRTTSRLVPRFVAAVSLLRRCGGPAAVDALLALARDDALQLNVRTGIAMTLERLAEAQRLRPDQREPAVAALRELQTRPCPDVQVKPCRNPYAPPSPDGPHRADTVGPKAVVDLSWQLELAVSRAVEALQRLRFDTARWPVSPPAVPAVIAAAGA